MYYLVSVASISVVVALDRHQSVWRLARAKLGFLAIADLGLGLFGATLALVLSVAPGWAPALTLPALLVYMAKRSHEALRGSETRLKAMVASALDAIITLDVDGRVVLFNQSAEKMFGCGESEAIGRSFDDFLPRRPKQASATPPRMRWQFGTPARYSWSRSVAAKRTSWANDCQR